MPGARIGDYVIDHELSGTDSSTMYLGAHAVLPRTAYVIVGAGALIHEACVLEALHGPGVPRVYECGVLHDGRVWIAIERIPGPTIADVGPLSARDGAVVLRDVGAILERAAASRIVHGRLEPRLVVRGPDCWSVVAWTVAAASDGDPRDDVRELAAIVERAVATAYVPLRLVTLIERARAGELSAMDLRHRAAQLIDAGELDEQIVQVEVELVDIGGGLG